MLRRSVNCHRFKLPANSSIDLRIFGAAVAGAEDDMDMQGRACPSDRRRPSPIRESDFDLLADRNLQVVLLLPIEVEQDRIAQSADRGEARRVDISLLSKSLKHPLEE